ncbi:glycerol-3-phosphate acyltransferase 2, mitochondrial isoform X5 [Hypanus sabinus]|uniref:glycerol-3-phosphate acyltransferase 2, mitochondrial isoform X5 n=1 Tax=Hypanus sabinus TaxID=79690 RepID=UPI0028C42BB0|nr:glycerol-3-phosphate acyltransferase 2, mitochondrial isoform X5 [Hypanus sabinus]
MALKHDKGDGNVPMKSTEFFEKVNYRGVLSSGGVSLLLGNTRPFVGRCCYVCAPQSWGMLFHNYLTSLGFRNAILVTEKETRYRGWLARRLCHILFVAECMVHPDAPLLEHKINSARIQEAAKNVSDTPVSDQKLPCNVKNVTTILHQVHATISPLVLRTLLRRLGGIFTPPAPHGTKLPPGKNLYKTVLNLYVEKLLSEQQSLAVYLEDPVPSGRRPCCTGLEWLARVFDAFHNQLISDAVLIPVGVSYDRIVKENCYEQMGNRRTTVFAAICWMFRFLQKRYGCIRVDFGQPFSLKDYFENEGLHFYTSAVPLQKILLPCILEYSSKSVYQEKTVNNEGWSGLSKHHETLVANLGKHVLHTATCCSAVMSTTLVACLLLHKHQQGAFLTTLAKDFCWLMNEVLARHFDVGFSGQLHDILLHALFLLRDCVTVRRFSPTNCIVIPKTSKEAVEELSLCSSAVLPVFICEAVAACALNSLLREVAKYLMDWDSNVEVVISQEELTCKTLQLCHLLPSEVLLLPPCQSVYRFAQDAVDKLTYCEILVLRENENSHPACDFWSEHLAKQLAWKVMDDFDGSDSDCEEDTVKYYFKLGQTAESHAFFLFLCNLLRPVLKAYEMVAGQLHQLEFPMKESQCVLRVFKFLQTQVEECPGSASLYLANSAIKTFKELGVFEVETGVTGSLLELSETFQRTESRQKLQQYIQQFC